MSSAFMWRSEEFAHSPASQSTLLRDATLENRINVLREIAVTLLGEVDLLRGAAPTRSDSELSLHDEVQRFERELIQSALARTNGSQVRAARLLGVKHTTLNAKIKRYKICFVSNEQRVERGQNHGIAA